MAQSHTQPDPKQKTSDPDALVRRADGQRGLPAAETLLEAALAYRRRPDMVAAMHSLERALAELAELIESPPAARLGAELEYQLGILCEEELGRFEDALVHYQRAFKLRPDNLDPLRRGRVVYQSLGDMDMVARLIELHLANLVASETRSGITLALELGQLKLKLNDPAGAVEALRSALRMHNDAAGSEEIPELLLATLADAYVSPEYQPGIAEKDQARRHASEIYLSLAKRYLDAKLLVPHTARFGNDDERLIVFVALFACFVSTYFAPLRHKSLALVAWFFPAFAALYGLHATATLLAAHLAIYLGFHPQNPHSARIAGLLGALLIYLVPAPLDPAPRLFGAGLFGRLCRRGQPARRADRDSWWAVLHRRRLGALSGGQHDGLARG